MTAARATHLAPSLVRPLVLATATLAALAGLAAYLASGGRMPLEEVIGYAYSFAMIGGAVLALLTKGREAARLPRPNRASFMVAVGLLFSIGALGIVSQIGPSFRSWPAAPAEAIAWVQYLGIPPLLLAVVFYLAWCSPGVPPEQTMSESKAGKAPLADLHA